MKNQEDILAWEKDVPKDFSEIRFDKGGLEKKSFVQGALQVEEEDLEKEEKDTPQSPQIIT